MRRFVFRLEPVLRLRRMQEDEKKRAFALAGQRARQQAERLRASRVELALANRALAEVRKGTIDLVRARLQEGYVRAMERRVTDEERRLAEAVAQQAQAQREFIEARRRVRVLERLRERQWKRYLGEAEREERKVLDEVALAVRGVEP